MIGILVALVISWALLWLFRKEHIFVLGFKPSKRVVVDFFIGLILMAAFSSINHLSLSHFQGLHYVRNVNYSIDEALNASWWTFKAGLFEEVLFRGAILYLLIKKLGLKTGCILSAIAFGIYHWFSYNMFDKGLVPMIYIFLLTGAAGWMFAYAFAKSKSIIAPLGLHFGWIFMSIVIFSSGPLGDSMFIISGEPTGLGVWEQLWVFVFQTLLIPLFFTWYFWKKYKK